MEHQNATLKKSSAQKAASVFHGLQLLLIQSSVCILALLIVFCLRWIGGDLLGNVASLFRQAMLDDTLVTVVTTVFETDTVSAIGNTDNVSASEDVITPPLIGGVITSAFGERDGGFHEGVDIAADEGTPLNALLSGTVTTVAYEEKGYGHYVVVTCSANEKYLYAHCSAIHVKEGDTVKAGDTIADVGNTGRSSGSHLHVEWICDGIAMDPITILPEQTYA